MFAPIFSLPIAWLPLFYCKTAPVLHIFRDIHAIGRQKNKGKCAKLKNRGTHAIRPQNKVSFANGPRS